MYKIVLIGYSGHAYVVCDILNLSGHDNIGYCELHEMNENPFNLQYLGTESTYTFSSEEKVFIGIGNNAIREKIASNITAELINAIHPSALVAQSSELDSGILIAANATINPLAKIGKGAIINTGAIVEHECTIGDFAHVAPGAVLAGKVIVGNRSFIGANAVIKQGVNIGTDVVVGAGAVVLKDVPNFSTIVGNPGKILKKK